MCRTKNPLPRLPLRNVGVESGSIEGGIQNDGWAAKDDSEESLQAVERKKERM